MLTDTSIVALAAVAGHLLFAFAPVSYLFPDPPRRVPGGRLLGVALRTAHLVAVGTLLGGHVFDVDPERLVPALGGAIVTGAGMIALELVSTCDWLCRAKGGAALVKLGILALVPVFWEERVALLVTVTVVAGIASHLPGRFRHARVFRWQPPDGDARHTAPNELSTTMASCIATRGRTTAWTDGAS